MNTHVLLNELRRAAARLVSCAPTVRLPMMILAAALALTAMPSVVQAQSFELTQSQPSAGGGVSSGGEFSLIGSVAQVAAAPTSGGEFDVLGGFNPACDVACRLGDLNCDGVVDANDIAEVLAWWGPCTDASVCLSDIDGDGVVGPSDLSVILTEWD